jgi:hypothetical protein
MRFPEGVWTFKIAGKSNLMTSWDYHDGYFSTAMREGIHHEAS